MRKYLENQYCSNCGKQVYTTDGYNVICPNGCNVKPDSTATANEIQLKEKIVQLTEVIDSQKLQIEELEVENSELKKLSESEEE